MQIRSSRSSHHNMRVYWPNLQKFEVSNTVNLEHGWKRGSVHLPQEESIIMNL
jgi:hypothetical protein